MKQIFPKEIIENSTEVHQFRHSSKSKIIYVLLLSFMFLILISLPFINVDVYTSGRGIIKPNKDRLSLTSIETGKIITSNIVDNKNVTEGDILIVLDSDLIDERIDLIQHQIYNSENIIHDLEQLSKNKNIDFNNLASSKYKKEYLLFQQNRQEKLIKFQQTKIDNERNFPLFQKEVISKIEYEKIKYEYDSATNNLNQLEKHQQNVWQADLTNYKDDLLQQKSTYKELIKSKDLLTIKAPITGTLLNVKSLEVGSILKAGESFTEISPNTELRVECFIPPADIGLLKTGNEVTFLVDAYNYNQWGVIDGSITEIGNDMELINENPMFKIICSLNQKTLYLKNGFEGKLKKGMTLNTQFKIAERSLFDLLYDKTDDWLNPSQYEIANNIK